MLVLPNLDDRFFEDFVNEAREMIPRIIDEWTDANDHDPGITFIELFSWLIEMQQYYMNQIVDKSEINFLKLLGTNLKPLQCAKVDVTFKHIPCTVTLPKRTRFAASDLIFESIEPHTLIQNHLEKIIVRDRNESNDYSNLNNQGDNSFYAFGAQVSKGNTMYLGFERQMDKDTVHTIHFYLYDKYPVPLGKGKMKNDSFEPSGKVSWKYYGYKKENGKTVRGWFPINIIEDETFHFTKSGKIKFIIPEKMEREMIYPANDKGRYWLSCSVEVANYEIAPRVQQISFNTIEVEHRLTLSDTYYFSGRSEPYETIMLTDYLSFYEKFEVQVRDEKGYWQTWSEVENLIQSSANDKVFTVMKDEQAKKTKIQFGNGKNGRLLPTGENNVRIISYDESFAPLRIIGRTNGLPQQVIELFEPKFIPETLQIQIGYYLSNREEIVWEDWSYVTDFMNSTIVDRHFTYDRETGQFQFGNNEKGIVPNSSSFDNIKIIRCHTGGGSKGNIKEHSINTILSDDPVLLNVEVTNDRVASGGAESETIEEAKRRFLNELENDKKRAITAEDYEIIAKNTPYLRVARAKALPLYTVGLQDYPNNKVPAIVTIVVVPYSEQKKPVPSEGFIKTVKNYLSQHRLITTEIQVVAPEYIKISVYAVVVVEPYLKGDRSKILQALNRYLHPLAHDQSGGWEFGRAVYKGDIFSVINEVEGVTFIQDLWIEGEGKGIRKEASGNIIIPPHGLVYSGEHHIEVISRTDL